MRLLSNVKDIGKFRLYVNYLFLQDVGLLYDDGEH